MSSEVLPALREVEPLVYEIPKDYRADMRVPARLFASPALLEKIRDDRSLWQLVNTTTLPGIVRYAAAMPDIHEGYGFPIGGVVATREEGGVVSPGGVGYDINCGVRAILTGVKESDAAPRLRALVDQLFRDVPGGAGKGGRLRLGPSQMSEVLAGGAAALVRWGYGRASDVEAAESGGRLPGALPDRVSDRARLRGADQLGTLGSGNHFLEIDAVDEVEDADTARAWGLEAGEVAVLVHTGSRGVGHQTCTDYVRRMIGRLEAWGIRLPDRELACAPLDSPEGRDYLGAMAAAANFAWANRQMITHRIREAWDRVVGRGAELRVLYDVAHNIAKMETHAVGGTPLRLCVHRKGATRAFPKGHPDLAPPHRATGQPVIIPGTMGTHSYLLVGGEAMERSFGTVCHGAGRVMSRAAARRATTGSETRARLGERGILVRCESNPGLAEEAPMAYKDVGEVVDVVHRLGLARRVARLRPLAVIKGG
jgi:tRNA-splicing ligase RtcB